jgi:hypothetical protein
MLLTRMICCSVFTKERRILHGFLDESSLQLVYACTNFEI